MQLEVSDNPGITVNLKNKNRDYKQIQLELGIVNCGRIGNVPAKY